MNFVIDYLTENGVMEPERLWEPPATDWSPSGLDGLFTGADADKIVALLRGLKRNALRPGAAS